MLPPIDETVLQNNPDFAALYHTLTSVVLNPDGSTKHDPAAQERHAVREKLKQHRLRWTKHQLLLDALATAYPAEPPAPKPSLRRPRSATHDAAAAATAEPASSAAAGADLPQELLDLLVLLPPLLTTTAPLPADALSLLLASPPFSSLPSLLPQLARLVSQSLHATALSLARLANPSTNPSYLHRAIPALPSAAAAAAAASSLSTDPCAARLAAASSLATLQAARTSAIRTTIRALEAKHGGAGAARALELRAASTACEAQRLALRAEEALWTARGVAFPAPASGRALAAYAAHLRRERARLREEVRGMEDLLAAYGVGSSAAGGEEPDRGKGKTMREMARVYKDMRRQVDEVKADLARLRRA